MVAEEGLKIGVRLIITVAFILLGIVCIKMSWNMISSKVSNAAGFAATSDNSLAKSLTNRTSKGSSVINLVDEYYRNVPVLLVTGETYNTQEKFTYDLDSVHDSSNAAYINPLLDYRVDVGFNQDNDVGWVRIVQSDLVGKADLPTVQNTISSYNDLQSKFKLQKTLIEDQYALYQKHK